MNDETKLWLWKNGDHFLAFESAYPCFTPGGDPMTLGEPAATAIFKVSHGRSSLTPSPAPSAAPQEADALREALEAFTKATAMSTYGDSSDFVWPVQTMRKPGEHAYGYICAKHGLGYTSSCVCCRGDYEEHSAQKDRQAKAARDDALKAAEVLARAALAQHQPPQQGEPK